MRNSTAAGLIGVLVACGFAWGGWQPPASPAKPVAPAGPAAASNQIPVKVSTRVELLSIVFQLAGAQEYNQLNAQSAYAQRSQEYFRGFAGHEVVNLAREYRKNNGVGHDAVMSFAVHLAEPAEGEPLFPLKPKILFDFNPARLDKRWSPERANKFLEALNRFAVDSKAEKFFASNAEFYSQSAARLSERVNARPYRAWLDGFFGAKPGAVFMAVPGLLNGGSNYGVGVLYANGKEDIVPVIGVHRFDAGGLPVFEESDGPTIVHEFCHAYVNPLVEKNWKELGPSFEKLFPVRSQLMRQQAYNGPKETACESLVRACTVRYAVEKEDAKSVAAQLADERARGFLWTGEAVESLATYQLQRDKYATLEAYMPELAALFAKLAEKPADQAKKVPTVAKVTPDVRAGRVDPGAKEIVIEFDRPMGSGFSFVGDAKQMPKTSATPWWGSDGKSLTLPVKLEAGKKYTLRLNSLQFHGFMSAEGYAMDPVEWTFTAVGK